MITNDPWIRLSEDDMHRLRTTGECVCPKCRGTVTRSRNWHSVYPCKRCGAMWCVPADDGEVRP
jgi:hypothetical protein